MPTLLTSGKWREFHRCRTVGLVAGLALLLSLAACSGLTPGLERGSTTRPNIVLIFVDDLGYNDVSYNGATEIETPNIDRLAREGVVFSSGYVVQPTCGPSRAGLLTGRHPARFGMESNLPYAPFDDWHGLPVAETTIATYLRNTGYRTGLVGKWQLGASPPFHPLNRGFDYFYGFLAGEHDYFTVDTTRPGFTYLPLNDNRGAAGFDGYLTDALTDQAVKFVNDDTNDANAAAPKPFFLYLAYNTPHTPLQAPRELVQKYSRVADVKRRTYLAMVDSLDQNVGRVLAALERAGKRDNTLIFFLSDNGGVYPREKYPDLTWGDNAPFSGGKGSFLEGGIRVPFIASWPARWPRGKIFEPMVSSMDIAATALSLAGGAAAPDRPLDGVNLHPYLIGERNDSPHAALFWRLPAGSGAPLKVTKFAVRSGRIKLVKDTEEGEAQLFDLERDPGETRNLIDDEAETAARLAKLWNAWNRENLSMSIYVTISFYESGRAEFARAFVERLRLREAERPNFQIIAPGTREASCSNGIVVPNPENNPGLVGDCVTLMAVKDSLTGGAGTGDASLNWDYAEPISNWDSVAVSGEPNRVRELQLELSGLAGTLPPRLGDLDGLVKLYLGRNRLTGPVPPELGDLADLQVLSLGRNRLTGPVPPELGDLADLQILSLALNRLTGPLPPELGDLANLKELWLQDNGLAGSVPPEWGNLGELELIRLEGNQLTGCLPASFRRIDNTDFVGLELDYCAADGEGR